MISKKLILTLGFFISACSRTPVHNGYLQGVELGQDSVAIDGPVANGALLPSLPSKEQTDVFGPQPDDANVSIIENDDSTPVPEPVIGLILGPGLYRSLGLVGLFKAFAKKNTKISVIFGQEMSAIVALYFSKFGSTSQLEWLIYKLTRSGNLLDTPYTEKWRRETLSKLTEEFKNVEFEDLKIPTFITLYNNSTNLVEHFAKGPVYGPLLRTFEFSGQHTQVSSAKKLAFPVNFMRKMGADIVLVVDVLGKNVKFKNESQAFMAEFQKISARIQVEKNSFDHYFFINLSQDLDSPRAEESVRVIEMKGMEMAEKIRDLVVNWKKKTGKIIFKK